MSRKPNHYRICMKGHLDPSWSDQLSGLVVENLDASGEKTSILSGPLADQSALSGIINTLVDMHYEVLSVNRVESHLSETS